MKPTTPNLFAYMGWNCQGDLGPFTSYTSKRGKTVFFVKSPPKCPPSNPQIIQRTKFKIVAQYWQAHTQTQRDAWEHCTKKLRLKITGYNLFIWYHLIGDRQTLATIERHAGLTLISD